MVRRMRVASVYGGRRTVRRRQDKAGSGFCEPAGNATVEESEGEAVMSAEHHFLPKQASPEVGRITWAENTPVQVAFVRSRSQQFRRCCCGFRRRRSGPCGRTPASARLGILRVASISTRTLPDARTAFSTRCGARSSAGGRAPSALFSALAPLGFSPNS